MAISLFNSILILYGTQRTQPPLFPTNQNGMQISDPEIPIPPPQPPIMPYKKRRLEKCIDWFRHIQIRPDKDPKSTFGKFQKKIIKFIESTRVQYSLIALMIVDISLLMVDLVLEAIYGHHPPPWLKVLENINYWSTLVVLIIFEFELFMLMVGYGWRFLFHPMYVIDWIFITAALILEIIFKDTLLVLIPSFLRIWRIIRIAQAVALAEEEYHHSERHKLKVHIHELEAEAILMRKEIETLKKSNPL